MTLLPGGFEILPGDGGGGSTPLQALPTIQTEYAYCGLCRNGDYILAAGFGPQSVQEIAKVARLGYYLENARLTPPNPPVNGGESTGNFAAPRIRIGGEVLDPSRYDLDLEAGHLLLKFLPENGLTVRTSYDYESSFGLVQISEENRWDLACEVAWGNGLVLAIDPFDRLTWQNREFEEVFVAANGKTHVLGATSDADGVPWIIAETIQIVEHTATGAAVSGDLYTLLSEPYTTADGQEVLRWRLSVNGTLDETNWLILFSVQQTVMELDYGHIKFSGEVDSGRIISKVTCKGARRVAADFPERIEQVFAVAPGQADLASSFERLKPVEGTKVFNWNPTELIYDESTPEEQPKFHITFNEPMVLGSSRWGVEYGKLPLLLQSADLHFYNDTQPKAKFRKYAVTGAVNSGYHVWLKHPGSYRLATADDFDDMSGEGNCLNGEYPTDAADVRTETHFYLKKMNALASEDSMMLVYESEMVWFAQDADGRTLRRDEGGGMRDEERFRTAYSDRAAVVVLRPQDDNEQPLFFDNPLVGVDAVTGNEARMVIERVQLAGEGLKIDFTNFANRQNWLTVEVIGYPAAEAEKFVGTSSSATAIALYGEQEKTFDNRFFPNLKVAQRQARRALSRRAKEPVKYTANRPLCLFVGPGELVRVAVPRPTSKSEIQNPKSKMKLLRVAEVTHRLSGGGSGTEIKLEI